MKDLPGTGQTIEDLVQLLGFKGETLDAGIITSNDDGYMGTLADIHMRALLKIASRTMPEHVTDVTSFGISKEEYGFMDHLAKNFLGVKDSNWLVGRIMGYLRMHDREQREGSEKMHQNYAGFMDFFSHLGDLKALMLDKFKPELVQEHIDNIANLEEREKLRAYLVENRNCNWKEINNLAAFWGIDNAEQFDEAMKSGSVGAKIYEPRIKRTKESTILVKALVHGLVRDGKIDVAEKRLAREFLLRRFEGFDVDETCVDEMLRDVSRKDALFFYALNNPSILDEVRTKSGHVITEIQEVVGKIDKARELLDYFGEGKIDSENLHLVCYTLQNIVGIRGLSNISLILGDHGVTKEQLKAIKLYDVPLLAGISKDRKFALSEECSKYCPEIYLLATENPFLNETLDTEGIDEVF